jgi:hypothetical protein
VTPGLDKSFVEVRIQGDIVAMIRVDTLQELQSARVRDLNRARPDLIPEVTP